MAIVSMLYGAGGASSADEVSYDNTTSGLEAENVQDALDENSDSINAFYSRVVHDYIGTTGTITLTRVGKLVTAVFNQYAWQNSVTNIPEGYRPRSSVAPIGIYLSSSDNKYYNCTVYTAHNGDIIGFYKYPNGTFTGVDNPTSANAGGSVWAVATWITNDPIPTGDKE